MRTGIAGRLRRCRPGWVAPCSRSSGSRRSPKPMACSPTRRPAGRRVCEHPDPRRPPVHPGRRRSAARHAHPGTGRRAQRHGGRARPRGQARVRVPPGTQPGSVLRVAGQGLPRYGGHGRGSLDLTVILDIPRRLSPRQRQLYEQHRAEDAGTRSTTDGSGEPDAPRSGRRITADAGGRHAAGRGLLIIASVPLLVIGVPNLAGGIAAIAGSQILIVGAHSVSGGLRAWGWGMAVFGVAQLLAAAGSGRAASGPDGPMVRRGSGPAHRCRPDVLHPRLSALAGGDEEMPLPDGRGWPDQNHGSGPHTRVLVLAVRASVAKSAAGCRG